MRASPGRGRPPKFGRPSQVVALTLPQDVLQSLRTVHRDLGWAVVQVVEARFGSAAAKTPSEPADLAELVHLPGGHALIVVQPQAFKGLRGVSTIPLTDGRAFLALDLGRGLADLEVAILDRLDIIPRHSRQHAELSQLRQIIRGWRRDSRLIFDSKSIIVLEKAPRVERRPLAALRTRRSAGSIDRQQEDDGR